MSASIITSVVTGGSNNHSTVAEEANTYATDWVSQGVLGSITNTNGVAPTTGSFGVNQNTGSDMAIKILGTGNTTSTNSIAYITGTPSTQGKQVVRARMSSDYTAYTINANSTGSTVYDFIYLQFSAANANVPSAAADNVVTLVTQRSTTNGTDSNGAPTYSILLAIVTVANGATSITNANIADQRTQASINSTASSNTNGWVPITNALTYSANNGNKQFQATASVDLTGTLSPGMKLKVSRSVTPPTYAALFASASSQYATKASPSGITFTGTFTCESWVYLNSYTGQNQYIINRTDSGSASGGWAFRINGSGQVSLSYGSGSSFTEFLSYQSVPLKRWVHLAGVVTSIASKTGTLYFNGISVPSSLNASAATTLTQDAVDLRVGAIAGGTLTNTYLDGYLSEVRVWSTNQTAANILANMTKNLTGSETNLVALYQFNNAWTDATTNANTLTANGGATFSINANPFNATEYLIVTAVSYSNPTTTVTLFGGTDYTLPNMTLNNPYYSMERAPYGFPAGRNKWLVDTLIKVRTDQTSPAAGTWYNTGSVQLSVPAGDWRTDYVTAMEMQKSASVSDVKSTLSTANNSESDTTQTSWTFISIGGGTSMDSVVTNSKRNSLSLSAQTTYYLNHTPTTASMASFSVRGDGAPAVVVAECAYV